MAKSGRSGLWLLWGTLTVATGGYLAAGLLAEGAARNPLLAAARSMLLPGPTTHGHHQIELACETCHRTPFGGKEALQEACVRCHGAVLKQAEVRHPLSKFTDPRNADRLEKLDATLCVTCHTEHRPQITTAMGLTQPRDYCFHCHAEIAVDRPSHQGMAFDTCASTGCHRYHDNRALYEEFIVRHLDEPALSARRTLRSRDFRQVAAQLPDYPAGRYPLAPLAQADADAPQALTAQEDAVADWLATAHAAAGVNCSGCHRIEERGTAAWIERPDHKVCASCHVPETQGFLAGKHGMRLAEGLGPMTPARARAPMRSEARNAALTCSSCHAAHRFDTRKAAVEACVGCHRDEHTLAYEGSPHHALWTKELGGDLPPGSGVSCASCHLPRVAHEMKDLGLSRTLVQHNQNDTLRPRDKMVRTVCLGCHGLGFAFDALADEQLVAGNFSGRPRVRVKSLDMVSERLRQQEQKRRERVAKGS